MDHMNYFCAPQDSLVEAYCLEGEYFLEVNTVMVAEPVLCLYNQEEEDTEVGAPQYQ